MTFRLISVGKATLAKPRKVSNHFGSAKEASPSMNIGKNSTWGQKNQNGNNGTFTQTGRQLTTNSARAGA